MNDGLMDDDDFDDMVMGSIEGLTITDSFNRSDDRLGPNWNLPARDTALYMRLPQANSDNSWVSARMDTNEVRFLSDGVEQAAAAYCPRQGELVSLISRPVPGGVRFDLTTRDDVEGAPRLLLRWFKYHEAPTTTARRRPWWRRWLDRAWPARARS